MKTYVFHRIVWGSLSSEIKTRSNFHITNYNRTVAVAAVVTQYNMMETKFPRRETIENNLAPLEISSRELIKFRNKNLL